MNELTLALISVTQICIIIMVVLISKRINDLPNDIKELISYQASRSRNDARREFTLLRKWIDCHLPKPKPLEETQKICRTCGNPVEAKLSEYTESYHGYCPNCECYINFGPKKEKEK